MRDGSSERPSGSFRAPGRYIRWMRQAGPTLRRRGWRPLIAAGAVIAVCVCVPVIVLASDGSHHGNEPTVTEAASSDPGVVATSSSPAAPVGSQPQRVGSLVQADALGNTVIGGDDRTQLSFRFRATWTGSVVAVRVYVIKNVNGRSGYSNGTGGTMRVALQGDSGGSRHVPSGRNATSTTFRPLDHGFWPLVRFDKPARVTKGHLYHIVFSNVDPDPGRNYVSINALYSASRLGQGPSVPDDLAVLEGDGGGGGSTYWHPRRSRPHEYYLPIMDVVGGRGGQHDGLGYMEVWDPKPIGNAAKVRQLLRSGRKTTHVRGVWFRVKRDNGESPLTLTIGPRDGSPLGTATVAADKVPTSDAGWVYGRFSSPVTLKPNQSLALTASASNGEAVEAFPLRKGNEFGFAAGLQFGRGYAQFNDGDGWVGWDQWGGHDRRTSDLQFALDATG